LTPRWKSDLHGHRSPRRYWAQASPNDHAGASDSAGGRTGKSAGHVHNQQMF
jgi:hypothetical protein